MTAEALGVPTGTVTFFFSDIEGSTRLLQLLGDEFGAVLERHAAIIRTAIKAHHGAEVSTEGDSFFAVFTLAHEAVACAAAVHRALHDEKWPSEIEVRVRIGLHTGEGKSRDGNTYVGIDVHRAARISACGHGGQTLLSASTADLAERALPQGARLLDLGRHELKDLAYPEHLFQLSVGDLPDGFPPIRTSTVATTNLPKRDTTFIGRAEETDSLAEALEHRRLVTLAGAAGVGKTSLAIHAAARTRPLFADGTWLAEIARLTDGSQIAPAVARELNIIQPPVEPVARTLSNRLAHSSLLLILDGCEHLVPEVAAFVDDLLRDTSGVHFLITSREPLALRAEHLLRLAPLATPPPDVQDPDTLITFDAVALLIERAKQVQPGFLIDVRNFEAVADIARRLDGIPLAIELAAAQLKVLSVRQAADRLDREFATIAAGRRDSLPHHKTLGATLDWSYESLTAVEQLLLARLSVFAGGFTLEAIEDMCCGGLVERESVVDVLGRLVDTSLVIVTESDPMRYRLLEPIAQYARNKLPEHEDPDVVHRLHADYYLRVAEEADHNLLGGDQPSWMHRLDHERYNLLTALAWMHEAGDTLGVLRMAAALRLRWMLRRDVAEGMKWLQVALDHRRDAPPGIVICALNGAALLAIRGLDFERAEKWLEEALRLSRKVGDHQAEAAQRAGFSILAWFRDDDDTRADALAAEVLAGRPDWWTETWMLAIRGTLARLRGDHQAADVFLNESHRILTARGGSFDLGWSYLRLGALAKDQGLYTQATRRLQEGRILLAEVGDPIGQAHADAGLGALAWLRGDRDQAMTLYRSVLAGFDRGEQLADNLFELRMMLQGRVTGDQLRQIAQWNKERAAMGDTGTQAALAENLFHLGKTAFRGDDLERARNALGESLLLCSAAEDYRGASIALIALGQVSAASGDYQEAARFLGCAAAVAEQDGFSPWPPLDEPDFDRHVEEARDKLDPAPFQEAWQRGRTMTLSEAVASTGVRPL